MQDFLRVSLSIAACACLLTACSGGDRETEAPSTNGEPTSPPEATSTATPPSSPSPSPAASPEAEEAEESEGNLYRDPEGAFEISFPDDYAKQPRVNGVTFVSADGNFGGEAIYFEEDEQLSDEELKTLFVERYQAAYSDFGSLNTELQPDKSVRIDWRGKNSQGQTIDAVSYIEQHGRRIYILNLYGIDESYDNYLDDANVIVGSYNVNPS
ncbi:hypothetical protein [Baaleninema simplex]|uniref:hypothetical protein n=1 Tax=Baaleninema simplex TaxID=2862350 RepID=UPI0003496D9D|nr:hypothetical protein [Baaleninema simplex]